MRELRNTKIIAVDHGYGNMKTPQPASKPMKLNQSSPGIFWNTTAFTTGSAKDTKNLCSGFYSTMGLSDHLAFI